VVVLDKDAENRFLYYDFQPLSVVGRRRLLFLIESYGMILQPAGEIVYVEAMLGNLDRDVYGFLFRELEIVPGPPQQESCGQQTGSFVAVNEPVSLAHGFHQSGGFGERRWEKLHPSEAAVWTCYRRL